MVMRSTDGGKTWTAINMDRHASNLIDIFFFDENRGIVLGGYSDKDNPGYQDVTPVVLYTEDGGRPGKPGGQPDLSAWGMGLEDLFRQ